MSDPVVLRVVRPYASQAELLEAEGWTIGMKRLVLIGARPLKKGTLAHVELVLKTGEKLVRAECKVIGMARPQSDRPKGLEVRLKRYGASTRRFLERATGAPSDAALASGDDASDRGSVPEIDSSPSASELDSSPAHSLFPGSDPEDAELNDESENEPEEVIELVSQVEVLDDGEPALAPPSSEVTPESDQSGVRARMVEPPADRDALLERLRERARRIAEAKVEG